jgi:PAS domain S-box-containing protein
MNRGRLSILLVEDDEDDYVMIRDLLAEIGEKTFALEWAATYEAAQEAMGRNAHQVCLLDYRLGERTGLELLRESVRIGFKAPIIFLTGQTDHDVDVAAMKEGAADYLVKGQIGSSLLERSLRYAIERAQASEALRLSEERYALAVRGANEGVWDWDLKTDAIYYSPRWKLMLGCKESDIGTSPEEWFSRVHPLDLERVKSEIVNHLDGRTSSFQSEHRLMHTDGTYHWILSRGLLVRDADGAAVRMAGSQTDIIKRKAEEEQLLRNALHEPPNDLPTRGMFMGRPGRAIWQAKWRL